jgi:hypothetical protein
MPVERLAILELYKHRVALCRGEETQWKLCSMLVHAACIAWPVGLAYHGGGSPAVIFAGSLSPLK